MLFDKEGGRVKTSSDKKHKLVSIDDTIMVPVPKVDHTRMDFANMMGMILQISIQVGLLAKMLSRNQLEVAR